MLYYTVDKSPEKDGVYVCKMGNDEDTILQWYGDHWEKINTGTLVLEPVKGWIGPLQREIPPPTIFGIGKINRGAIISQDHRFLRWPACLPSRLEYHQKEYKYEATNPDMLFVVEWNSYHWECIADGYGHLRSSGQNGDYGNGSILISKYEDVTLLAIIKNKSDISYSDLEETLKRALLSPQ